MESHLIGFRAEESRLNGGGNGTTTILLENDNAGFTTNS